MLFKTIFVIAAVAVLPSALSLTARQRYVLRVVSGECRALYPVSQQIIDDLNRNKLDDTLLNRQFLGCLARLPQFNLIRPDGRLNRDAYFLRIFAVTGNLEKAKQVVTRCVTDQSNINNAVFDTATCIYRYVNNFSPVLA